MTQSAVQLARAQDLQPLLDQVVAAGAPGILAWVQTPTDTVQLVSGVANRTTGAPMTPECIIGQAASPRPSWPRSPFSW
jgi:hypothetical protein